MVIITILYLSFIAGLDLGAAAFNHNQCQWLTQISGAGDNVRHNLCLRYNSQLCRRHRRTNEQSNEPDGLGGLTFISLSLLGVRWLLRIARVVRLDLILMARGARVLLCLLLPMLLDHTDKPIDKIEHRERDNCRLFRRFSVLDKCGAALLCVWWENLGDRRGETLMLMKCEVEF